MANQRLISCLMTIFCLVVVDGKNARLLSGIDPNNEVPQQYIAVFKAGSQNLQIPGFDILRTYTIGNRHFALVQVEEAELGRLLTHPTLEFLEANRWLHLENPPNEVSRLRPAGSEGREGPAVQSVSQDFEMCTLAWTNPAINAWGIIRTSYRDKPSYDGWGKPYVYGTNDAGDGVDIYVLDTGVYLEHVDFEGRASFGMVADGVGEAGDVDLHGHGTHVAGTAAGRRFGVAKKAKIISCKVFNETGSGSTVNIIQAIEWVVNAVKQQRSQGRSVRPVINMSLGGRGFAYASEIAIQEAIEEGVTAVTSAGNDEEDACVFSPARVSSVITVGATDPNDRMASFSNYGPCVDVLAPGVSIAGPYRNGTFGQENPYALLSGTSMASPHVAGIIARYLSSVSSHDIEHLTPRMIKAQINDQATTRLISYEGLAKWPTPNKLLYRGCGDGDKTQAPPPPTTPTTTTSTTTTTTSPLAGSPTIGVNSTETPGGNSNETTGGNYTETPGGNYTETPGSEFLAESGKVDLVHGRRSASDLDSSVSDPSWTANKLAPFVTWSLILMSITFGANIGMVLVFWIVLRRQRAGLQQETYTIAKKHPGCEPNTYSNKL